jgi:hypothetical protein
MDNLISNLFQKIEVVLLDSIKALDIDSEVYACGFWLFYCDYSVINPPSFAYNSSYKEKDERWAPPEWDVDVDDSVYDALSPIYEELSKLLDGRSDEQWEELIEFQWKFYSALCYKLNSEVSTEDSPFKNWKKSTDFVIGIFEEREGEEIYEKLVIDSLGINKAKELGVL